MEQSDITAGTGSNGDLAAAASTGWRDESGVTAIEYGLLAALIVVTLIAALSATGTNLALLYTVWTDAVIAAL